MRVVSVDQFEFENISSEESLEISTAAMSAFPFSNVTSFVASAISAEASNQLPVPVIFNDNLAYGLVRSYCERFAGVHIPNECTWPTYLFSDGPDEWHLVICAPNEFIRYYWRTSA
jgi:hypothetical protein